MKKIETAFSHIDLAKKSTKKLNDVWKLSSSNDEIISSKPKVVDSYQELVESIAQIAFYNQDYSLFFRGQSQDFKDEKGNTTIYPSIYRPDKNEKQVTRKFEELDESIKKLVKSFQRSPNKFAGTTNVIKYKELSWALAQHYEIIDTPVLDLTHSVHVASSFALKNLKSGEYGVVNVLGMPNITNTISYFTNEELAIIRLIAFGPPKASRIFMQEAYAVSPFPFTELVRKVDKEKFNFSRRLLAKFSIPKTEKFWGKDFSSLPNHLLLPEIDKFREFLAPHLIDLDAFYDYFSTKK